MVTRWKLQGTMFSTTTIPIANVVVAASGKLSSAAP